MSINNRDTIVNVRLRKGCIEGLKYLLDLHGYKTMCLSERNDITKAFNSAEPSPTLDGKIQKDLHNELMDYLKFVREQVPVNPTCAPEVIAFNHKVDAVEKERDELKQRVASLERNLENTRKQYVDRAGEIGAGHTQIKQLTEECDRLKRHVAYLEDNLLGVHKSHSELIEKLSRERVYTKQITEERDLTRKERDTFHSDREYFRQKLNSSNDEVKKLMEERGELLKRIALLKEEVNDAIESANDSEDDRVKQLEHDLSCAMADFRTADTEVSRLRVDIRKAQQQDQISREECAKLTNMLRISCKEREDLREQLNRTNDLFTATDSEKMSFYDELKKTKNEVERLRELLRVSRNETAEENDCKKITHAELMELRTKYANLDASYLKICDEIDSLRMDALRYRHIRDRLAFSHGGSWKVSSIGGYWYTYDAAVDASMSVNRNASDAK